MIAHVNLQITKPIILEIVPIPEISARDNKVIYLHVVLVLSICLNSYKGWR